MPTEFEWEDAKNLRNVANHGIDFEDAIGIWAGPLLVRPSDRDGEVRWLAVGRLDGREIAVAYTVRGPRLRLISARRARTNEREAYRTAFPG